MEIVQLSDLHVGAQFREEIFGNVIDEINSLKPEAVVITGDLTNEGLIEQYEKCKNLVSQIKESQLAEIMIIETRDIYYSRNIFHLKQKILLEMM